MKRPLNFGSRQAAFALGAFTLLGFSPAAEAACTPTGFFRDAINLTAALINPPGKVSGDVDATGCNIGIYYSSGTRLVKNANVHGANYFGIVNDGARVDILDSTISDIGETPFNGTQHGVAIYFAFGTSAKGNIINNSVWNYQKGGIVVNGSAASANVLNNSVIGLGPVNFIAQNGIQAGLGANVKIQYNLVTGNSYTGAGQTASAGILIYGGAGYGGDLTTGILALENTGLGNDVGIWLANLDAGPTYLPPATPTKNVVQGNSLVNNAINNTTGNGAAQGYQAGIADTGNADVIANNDICGLGYTPPGSASAALFSIDVTYTTNPKLKNNTTCEGSSWWSFSSSATTMAKAKAATRHRRPTLIH